MGSGSPKSTLCGLPKSGQESPNGGASQGNSPPSSPLEKKPTDPWDLLYEAAGEVARMRVTNGIPMPYGFHGHGGYAPAARETSPPPPPHHPAAAPYGTAQGGVYYHPFAHFIKQRQIMAARVGSDCFFLLRGFCLKIFLVLGVYVCIRLFCSFIS